LIVGQQKHTAGAKLRRGQEDWPQEFVVLQGARNIRVLLCNPCQ
jgi:hypothetical protein